MRKQEIKCQRKWLGDCMQLWWLTWGKWWCKWEKATLTRGVAINGFPLCLVLIHLPWVEQNSPSSLYIVHHPIMVKGRQQSRLFKHH